MKRQDIYFYFSAVCSAMALLHCTSQTGVSERNSDIFSEARHLTQTGYSQAPYTFDGNINTLVAAINALSNSTGADTAIADITIEGTVTIPSNYGIGLGSTGCGSNFVYQRAFVLEDSNAAVLVAYGLEPPTADATQTSSMKYIANARRSDMAVFGDRIRLTATRAVKYGGATGTIPIITDFKDVQVISSRNAVAYNPKSTAFTRSADLHRTRQIEGYIKNVPAYAECSSGTRQFQFNYQAGYVGTLCVGATSAADAQSCTGTGKVELRFQLAYALGAGTLSGFDTGDMFSYNFRQGARVRLTGAVWIPEYNADDTKLTLMLSQRIQAETLR